MIAAARPRLAVAGPDVANPPASTAGRISVGAARLRPKSHSRKLSPVHFRPTDKRPRPLPVGPFVSATYVSISATCSNACPFKDKGCYVTAGTTKRLAAQLDAAAHGHTAEEVIAEEANLIDRAFRGGRVPQDGARGGRDLRLHVGGDVGSAHGARRLASSARGWRARGGGAVWTFTHDWRVVPRGAWGDDISVLASVERPDDIEIARQAGYPSAIVVPSFPLEKAFSLRGSTARIVPCPAETKGTTCVECRLCLDGDLLERNTAIAFKAHGRAAKRVRDTLVQLRVLNRAAAL